MTSKTENNELPAGAGAGAASADGSADSGGGVESSAASGSAGGASEGSAPSSAGKTSSAASGVGDTGEDSGSPPADGLSAASGGIEPSSAAEPRTSGEGHTSAESDGLLQPRQAEESGESRGLAARSTGSSVFGRIMGFARSSVGLGLLLFLGIFVGMQIRSPGEAAHTEGDAHDHGAKAEEESAPESIWTCSMHPQIRMKEPGNCPICGMELIPAAVKTKRAAASDGSDHVEHRSRVELTPRARALASIKTEPVIRTEPRAEIRLLGRVDHDESRLRTVTPWTGGRIDRLMVRTTGTRIRKGRVVAKLYSPEIYTATRELVLAAKQAKKMSGKLGGASGLGESTLEAVRNRLRLLGVQDRLIAEIERSGKAPEQINIRSPYSGTVLERHVEEGQYVSAGTPLYSIANLSEVWVQIDAYESDLPYLHVGQEVELTVEAVPGEVFVGKIGFIDPVLDKRNRTARVRVEVANRDGQLSPGMFAQAVIMAGGDKPKSQLVVASSAPLFTGRRSVVYVELPDQEQPTFELREVRLGPKAGPVYPVLSGLSEGERVVSRGAFLLDADLQLSGGRSMMTLSDDSDLDDESALRVTPAFLESISPLVEAYLSAQEKLVADDFAGAKSALAEVATAVNELEPPGSREVLEAWQESASALSGHTRHAAKAESIGDARSAFEMVSLEIERVLQRFGNPTAEPLRVAFCPMAFDSRGARWIQRDEPLQNPYYGEAMLRCGEFRASVLPGERLPVSATAAESPSPSPAAAGGHNH
ncbi:MAG TPA: efflux RND transporter periplasmic adaptor subunit [Nannocystis exedens]|nr:efflux RND transporter periplasmic adaptor subunit [Nannocystis exedens]